MTIKTLIMAFIFSFSCGQINPMKKVEFLQGTWQVSGKEKFESWKKTKDGTLSGYGYKTQDNKEIILEYLEINTQSNEIIYTAKVPDQNQGKGIDFKLNEEIDDFLSFENLNHDFPKKIQYTLLTDGEIYVKVLGENDQGFEYKLIKVY